MRAGPLSRALLPGVLSLAAMLLVWTVASQLTDRPQTLPAPWQVALIEIEGGTHAATIGEAYRRAMRWLFEPAAATPRGKPGP